MTVIAWDGMLLAADKRMVSADCVYVTTKIRRLNDGRLVGAAGNTVLCQMFMDWLESGGDRPAIFSDKEDFPNGIEVLPNGQVYEHFRHGRLLLESKFTALGSGFHFAMGALCAGCHAPRAVEIASTLHPECGNGIDVLALGEL